MFWGGVWPKEVVDRLFSRSIDIGDVNGDGLNDIVGTGNINDSASMKVVMTIRAGDSVRTVKITRVGEKAKAFKTDQATFDYLMKHPTPLLSARDNTVREQIVFRSKNGYFEGSFLPQQRAVVAIYSLGGRLVATGVKKDPLSTTFCMACSLQPGLYVVVKSETTSVQRVHIL